MTVSLTTAELAKYIDATALKADTSEADVRRLVAESREAGVKSVCINPVWVPLVAAELAGSDVLTCTVIGFPLGANASEVKAFEARQAIDAGADEVDMVLDVAAARAGDRDRLVADVRAVAEAAHADGPAGDGGALLKVIVETALLDDDAIVLACEAAVEAGADFVKTSTGFSTAGATVEHVALMRRTVGEDIGVKASGGVRTREDALAMIEAGPPGSGPAPPLLSWDPTDSHHFGRASAPAGTAPKEHHVIRNGKAIDHSNVGGVWGSLIAFIVAFGAFLGCLYAMGFWSLESVWVPGLIALALATVAFMIPQVFLGRSDTVDTTAIHTRPVVEHAASGAHAVETGAAHR